MRITGSAPQLFTCGTLEAHIFHLVAAWEIEDASVYERVRAAAESGPLSCDGCVTLTLTGSDADAIRLRIEGAALAATVVVATHGGRTLLEVRSGGCPAPEGRLPDSADRGFRELVASVARVIDDVAAR